MNPVLLATLLSLAATDMPHPVRPGGAVVARHVEPTTHDGYEVACPRDIDAAFASLDAALHEMAGDVDGVRGRSRHRLQHDLERLVDAAEEARAHACGRPTVIVMPPPPPPQAVVVDDNSHHLIVKALQREAFDDGRLGIIDSAVRGDMCLTAPQVSDYLNAFSFSGNRLDVLRRLAPRLVDDKAAIVIYRSFDFNGDKEDAGQVLSSRRTLAACALPWLPSRWVGPG